MSIKVTLHKLAAKKKAGEKITALTAYDFSMAKVMDESGIDLILVGDSLGMVVLGYPNTLSVTMDEMIHHTKAVRRGVKNALLVGDMPFLSYGVSEEITVANAGRFLQEGGAQAVKVEGGKAMAGLIKKMVSLGISVLGHIGMMPTHVFAESGYHTQGKDTQSKQELIDDALALENAGAFGIVLECIPSALAQEITSKVKIPTLGIGAGPHCDGQILVSYDLLGLYEEIQPKFVKCYAHMAKTAKEAIKSYKHEVESGIFPDQEHSY